MFTKAKSLTIIQIVYLSEWQENNFIHVYFILLIWKPVSDSFKVSRKKGKQTIISNTKKIIDFYLMCKKEDLGFAPCFYI